MNDWKMFDGDGHVRELEQEVFEYLPDSYRHRREAMLYFPLLPHHGWHRQALGSPRSGFLIPTLEDWQAALNDGDLESAVLYPTRFMHIGQIGIPEFAVDLARAYNDAELLYHAPKLKGRSFPHEGILDMAAAVKEFLTREDVPAKSKRKIANENPRRLYGLRCEGDGCDIDAFLTTGGWPGSGERSVSKKGKSPSLFFVCFVNLWS